jgi:phosphoserine phosphatase
MVRLVKLFIFTLAVTKLPHKGGNNSNPFKQQNDIRMKIKYISLFLVSFLFIAACSNPPGNKNKPKTDIGDTVQTASSKTKDTVVATKPKKPAEPVITPEKPQKNKKPAPPSSGKSILPSWNDTKSKQTIIDFVKSVTTKGSPDYIPPEDRIAAFDNDGTLISEQPTYFQIEFVLYRIKKMAPNHPKWKKDKLMQAAINHDLETLRKKFGLYGIGKLMTVAQADITTDQYDALVKEWMKNGRHPVTGKPYSRMVFQPMMELVHYLQQNGFKVYIVSGGDTDFMRAWSESVYGIPKENVIGSYQKLKLENKNGKTELIRSSEIFLVNDDAEKPNSIFRALGRRPVLAFGNSDGDIQMLQWCSSGKGKHLVAFIHHTDAQREHTYDKESRLTSLNQGLELAAKNKWLVVDIKKEWKIIYPRQP